MNQNLKNKKKEKSFAIDLTVQKPWYYDLMTFGLIAAALYLTFHVAMNWGAYRQIFTHRAENLYASIIELSPQVSAEELPKVQPKVELLSTGTTRAKTTTTKSSIDAMLNREVVMAMEILPPDNRIVIPSIDKNIPLIEVPVHNDWERLEENIQEGLRNGVVTHPISHKPHENGNFFITGHSSYYKWDPGRFKDVFALLHNVEPGAEVEIYYEGQKYVYRIDAKKVVEPTDIEVLEQPHDRQMLSLMTCTPIGTNKQRLILTGTPVEQ